MIEYFVMVCYLDADGTQTMCIYLSRVKVSVNGIPKRWYSCRDRSDRSYALSGGTTSYRYRMSGNFLYLEMLSIMLLPKQLILIFFSCQICTNKTRAVQKAAFRALSYSQQMQVRD